MFRVFIIHGMHCSGCAAAVERVLKKYRLREVHVDFLSGKLSFAAAEDNPEDSEIIKAVSSLGFTISAAGSGPRTPEAEAGAENLQKILSLVFCWLLAAAMFGTKYFVSGFYYQFIIAVAVCLPGREFFVKGYTALFHLTPTMDTLIALSASVSILYSLAACFVLPGTMLYFDAAVMVVTMLKTGKFLEEKAARNTLSAVDKLLSLAPAAANLLVNGQEIKVPASILTSGAEIVVRTGEHFPADGEVLTGTCEVDEAMLTGECLPVGKSAGAAVFAGAVNLNGTVQVKVTGAGSQSRLGRIANVMEEAMRTKPEIAGAADAAAKYFVPGIIVLSLLCALFWWFYSGFADAMHYGVSVLVVSCPCALGLATPLALVAGIGRGAEAGLLIKNAKVLELLNQVRMIFFDKTGTLTAGRPEVEKMLPAPGFTTEISSELKRALYALERHVSHPISVALCRYAVAGGNSMANIPEAGEPVFSAGKGVQSTVAGVRWGVGNAVLMRQMGAALPPGIVNNSDRSVVYCCREQQVVAELHLRDQERPEAAAVLAALRKNGIKTVILSGDLASAVQAAADRLHPDFAIGGLLPEDKLTEMQKIRCALPPGTWTAAVGDGINDALILTAAEVGIAFAGSSDIAVTSASVVLLKSDLRLLPALFQLGNAVLRTIKFNLFWAFAYNILAIPLAAGCGSRWGITFNPATCAAAMACSSLFVVLNSLHLRRLKFIQQENNAGKK